MPALWTDIPARTAAIALSRDSFLYLLKYRGYMRCNRLVYRYWPRFPRTGFCSGTGRESCSWLNRGRDGTERWFSWNSFIQWVRKLGKGRGWLSADNASNLFSLASVGCLNVYFNYLGQYLNRQLWFLSNFSALVHFVSQRGTRNIEGDRCTPCTHLSCFDLLQLQI